jgi:hypothetical protein
VLTARLVQPSSFFQKLRGTQTHRRHTDRLLNQEPVISLKKEYKFKTKAKIWAFDQAEGSSTRWICYCSLCGFLNFLVTDSS